MAGSIICPDQYLENPRLAGPIQISFRRPVFWITIISASLVEPYSEEKRYRMKIENILYFSDTKEQSAEVNAYISKLMQNLPPPEVNKLYNSNLRVLVVFGLILYPGFQPGSAIRLETYTFGYVLWRSHCKHAIPTLGVENCA